MTFAISSHLCVLEGVFGSIKAGLPTVFANPRHCQAMDILSIRVWTLSSWSLSSRRPFRSFTSPSSTSFPVFPSMLRSCTISASSLLQEAVAAGVLLLSPAFGSFPPTGVAASSSLLSAVLSYSPSSTGSSREATVCFNSFISFITDLNMTA